MNISISQYWQDNDLKKYINAILSAFEVVAFIVLMVIQYYQFQIVTAGATKAVFQQDIVFFISNLAILSMANLLLSVFVGNLGIVLGVTSVLCTIWSIAHHYVVQLHGGPLFFSAMKSASAAMSVLGGYDITINPQVKRLIECFAVLIIGSVIIGLVEKKKTVKRKNKRIIRLALLSVNAIYLYIILFSPNAIRPKQMITWSWETSINDYGFFLCTMEDFEKMNNPYIEPDGYDAELIQKQESTIASKKGNLPDVILILNESFYDLDIYTDTKIEQNFFEEFYEMDNAVTGYAVVPNIGGGTNNSEYELLTSHSMRLLCHDAPFNYVDFTKSEYNVIKYFEKLGYISYGFHGADGNNYSRAKAYPAIGFDNVSLGWEYSEYKQYGNRIRLDDDEYQYLIEKYEDSDITPKIMYLLTYQNHGGYEQNESSYDTVLTANNYGDLTDDVNEYMTSVALSVTAFKELTEYFSEVERPVIVCMVGDHAPSFIRGLSTDLSEDEQQLYSKLVPYIIWNNFGAQLPQDSKYVTLTDLVPMIVEAAELPVTTYYKHILELQQQVPIRTSDGKFFDKELNELLIEDDSKKANLLEQYYFMEYNSLSADSDYIELIFMPFSK